MSFVSNFGVETYGGPEVPIASANHITQKHFQDHDNLKSKTNIKKQHHILENQNKIHSKNETQ